jgi:hypothetical protein
MGIEMGMLAEICMPASLQLLILIVNPWDRLNLYCKGIAWTRLKACLKN